VGVDESDMMTRLGLSFLDAIREHHWFQSDGCPEQKPRRGNQTEFKGQIHLIRMYLPI